MFETKHKVTGFATKICRCTSCGWEGKVEVGYIALPKSEDRYFYIFDEKKGGYDCPRCKNPAVRVLSEVELQRENLKKPRPVGEIKLPPRTKKGLYLVEIRGYMYVLHLKDWDGLAFRHCTAVLQNEYGDFEEIFRDDNGVKYDFTVSPVFDDKTGETIGFELI